MYSLFSFDPGTWLSDGLEKVAGAALQVFRTICYYLDTIIYKLIISLYKLFEVLCTSRILSTEDFGELSKRIGFILGMIMLFRVIFSFIQMLVDPDTINDKEKGAVSIVKKCIIVIVMLGVSSFVFDTLHSVQNVVINNHIISRLLLPKVVDTDNFGAMLSEQILMSFYTLNEDTEGTLLYDHCSNYINGLKNQIIENQRFDYGYNCLNETIIMDLNANSSTNDENSKDSQELFIIEFNPLSVLVGIVLVWLLFRYCISVGVRVIQLTVLEIISPMPIIAYLSPKKDNMFSKWSKMYVSTYIDAFIRIAIINFVVYICANILDYWESGSGTFWSSVGVTSDSSAYTKGFIAVVMILALLTFAKKAPELLKELLPASASKIGFGVGMKDVFGLGALIGAGAGFGIGTIGRVPSALSNTGRAIGMLGRDVSEAHGIHKLGAALRGTGRLIGTGIGSTAGVAFGGASGVIHGGHAGFGAKGGVISAAKAGQQAQSKANLERSKRQLAGGHWYDGVPNAINNFTGNVSEYERLEAANTSYSNLKSEIDNDDKVKNAQTAYNAALSNWIEQDRVHNTAENFESAGGGDSFSRAIKAARENVYNAKMGNGSDKDEVFQEKVRMHNRRFGTNYNASTGWSVINDDRKEIKKEYEMAQAQKTQK